MAPAPMPCGFLRHWCRGWHQEGSGKASREGSQRQSHPGGRRPASISHRTAQPHRGKDLALRRLLSGAHGTHVRVAVPEEFVEDVAELPAEHRVARQRQPVHHRPEGLRPLLVVRAQDAWWWPVKETFLSPSAVMESGHPKAGWYPQSRGELGHRRELISCQAWVHIVPKGGTCCPLSSSPTSLLREHRGTLRTGAAPPLSLPGCPAGMLGIRFQRQHAHRQLWGLSILGPGRQPAAGILPPPHGTAAPGAHGWAPTGEQRRHQQELGPRDMPENPQPSLRAPQCPIQPPPARLRPRPACARTPPHAPPRRCPFSGRPRPRSHARLSHGQLWEGYFWRVSP